ncbi:MAG: hypothetical protein QGF53_08700, partial [Alphaproteobacteria bacterium]|nr:hypothetical protein [Alphaproteobacteria bacterium]
KPGPAPSDHRRWLVKRRARGSYFAPSHKRAVGGTPWIGPIFNVHNMNNLLTYWLLSRECDGFWSSATGYLGGKWFHPEWR